MIRTYYMDDMIMYKFGYLIKKKEIKFMIIPKFEIFNLFKIYDI